MPKPFRSNGGWGGYSGDALKKRMELQKLVEQREKTALIAWDPVKQEVRWRVPLPRHGNGGVLTTAGNLVFEGTTKQTFAAYPCHRWRTAVGNARAVRAGVGSHHL